MSLDVYLKLPGATRAGSGIFVRKDGQTREIPREEWDRLHPGEEPITMSRDEEDEHVFSANITHNLGKMADRAGIYQALWRPDEIGITHARQLIEPLTAGVAKLQADPGVYTALNPSNGWGSYAHFVPWVKEYLAACLRHPDADVLVSR